MSKEKAEHTDSAAAADATQDELLQADLKDAEEHKDDKEEEWEEGRKEVSDLEGDPPADKEDFPDEGKGKFETMGEDEEPPKGSPQHDRGSISGQ